MATILCRISSPLSLLIDRSPALPSACTEAEVMQDTRYASAFYTHALSWLVRNLQPQPFFFFFFFCLKDWSVRRLFTITFSQLSSTGAECPLSVPTVAVFTKDKQVMFMPSHLQKGSNCSVSHTNSMAMFTALEWKKAAWFIWWRQCTATCVQYLCFLHF